MYKRSLQALRDVNHEVAHVLKLVDNVDVIHARLVVLIVVIQRFNLCLAQLVTQRIDLLLSIIRIRNAGQRTLVRSSQVGNHQSRGLRGTQQYHVVRYHGIEQDSWPQQDPRLGSAYD